MRRARVLITCEHGGNAIPQRYRSFFIRHRAALRTHLGYDIGALALARDMAAALAAPLIYSTTSRLLADLNRSPHHPRVHAEPIRAAGTALRREVLARYHAPYRDRAANWVARALARGGRVVHLSCHTFTPSWNGVRRSADIGLLFDPRRAAEAALCRAWQRALRAEMPRLSVRLNYPYRGTSDGLTKTLRQRFDARRYLGLEVEVNQKYPLENAAAWRRVRRMLARTFGHVLQAHVKC